MKLSHYLVKYLVKSYTSTKKQHWRTKATKKYGVRYLTEAIEQHESHKITRILCHNPTSLTLRNGLSIPASLIKKTAYQVIAERMSSTQTLALPSQNDLSSLVKDIKAGGNYQDLMNFGKESLLKEVTGSENQEVIQKILYYLHLALHNTMEDHVYGNA